MYLSSELLPWHNPLWKRLWHQHYTHTLPHALLLHGISGLGKQHFVESFAKALLCLSPKQTVPYRCNHCQSCLWFEAKTHPNYYSIHPETPEKSLGIDQIRQLTEAIRQTAQSYHAGNPYKIVLICPADALSLDASHALLKTLEEPPAYTLFILITAHISALAATIRSRCHIISLPPPTQTEAISWLHTQIFPGDHQEVSTCLQLAEGAPLKALSLLKTPPTLSYEGLLNSLIALQRDKKNPSDVAEMWKTLPMTSVLNHLMQITSDLVKCKLEISAQHWSGGAYLSPIKTLSETKSLDFLFHYLESLKAMQHKIRLHTLNPLLNLETLAYQFADNELG